MSSPSTPRSARASPGARSRQAPASPAPQVGEAPPKDFSFLLRRDIYHALAPLNVPAAFGNSPKQPDPATPLEQLLARGHFRAAATAAAGELTGGTSGGGVDPRDGRRILSLLYTRLACLTLIDATALAAYEAKALEDLNNARIYVDEATGEHLAPWELRVLHVHLQALGFGDARRAVMSYHDLAREARAHAARAAAAGDGAAWELWAARLDDLGVKVAGALVDMGDLAGAAHHLGGLRDGGDGKVALCKALLWLHVGDVERARESARRCPGAQTERLILALCDMADAKYEAALAKWQELGGSLEGDEMVGVNTAVCLLYLGRMHEVGAWVNDATPSSRRTGTRDARGAGRCGPVVAHAALQPGDHVRAVHEQEPAAEDGAGRAGGGHGRVAGGLGAAEWRL